MSAPDARGPQQVRHLRMRGAEAVLIREPGHPLATMHLRIGAGGRDDPAGRHGLAHVVEHMMFSGTATSGRRHHARTIEQAGGFLNAKTGADSTQYFHVVPADLLGTVLELEAARFGGTVFDEAGLAADKAIVLQERFQRVGARPFGDATERLLGGVYPEGSPYRHLPVGAVEDVGQVTVEDCLGFVASHYTSDAVKVVLLGGFDMDEALAGVERVLAALRERPVSDGEPTLPQDSSPAMPLRDRTVRWEIADAPGNRVFLGIPLPPAGTHAFDLAEFASVLLGFGVAGPLARTLVDERAVLESLEVRAVPRERGGSMGVVELAPRSGVDMDQVIDEFDAAMSELVGERGGLNGRHGLRTQDVARAQALYTSSWSANDDSQLRRAESLTLSLQQFGSVDAYLTQLDWINALTVPEVVEAVRMWHRPDARVEAVYRG